MRSLGKAAIGAIHDVLIRLRAEHLDMPGLSLDQAHVDRLLPLLDEMITVGALVTMERVRALKYAAGQKRATSGPRAQ